VLFAPIVAQDRYVQMAGAAVLPRGDPQISGSRRHKVIVCDTDRSSARRDMEAATRLLKRDDYDGPPRGPKVTVVTLSE
jgi:hypothetical protein